MSLIWFDDGSQGILRRELFPLSHYEYGEAFYGSYRGMRYRIAREPLENVHFIAPEKRSPAVIRVVVWPEPYSYAHTAEDQKVIRDFDYDQTNPEDDVLDRVCQWLNEFWNEHYRSQDLPAV